MHNVEFVNLDEYARQLRRVNTVTTIVFLMTYIRCYHHPNNLCNMSYLLSVSSLFVDAITLYAEMRSAEMRTTLSSQR